MHYFKLQRIATKAKFLNIRDCRCVTSIKWTQVDLALSYILVQGIVLYRIPSLLDGLPIVAPRFSSIGSEHQSSRGSIPITVEERSLLPTPNTDGALPVRSTP